VKPGAPFSLTGPSGALEAELHLPAGEPRFRAIVAHPHPLYGGTMDNAVVVLAARALVAAGGESLRFNFRGVGRSGGDHDRGRGEQLDLLAAIGAIADRRPALPLVLAGYSFGAVVTLDVLSDAERAIGPVGVLLIAPPVTHYEGAAWKLGSIPTVVVYGDRDALTPPPLLEERAARWGSEVRAAAVEGVGHDLGSFTAPAALERVLDDAVARLVAVRA
jgi:alpha/beta superfamily hydrolase